MNRENMRRRLASAALSILIALCAIAWIPTAAHAGGIAEATVSGPGFKTRVKVGYDGPVEEVDPWSLAERLGLSYRGGTFGSFRAAAVERPERLGPRYVVTYDGCITARQHIYPFAEGGPVAHTPPGQDDDEAPITERWNRVSPDTVRVLERLAAVSGGELPDPDSSRAVPGKVEARTAPSNAADARPETAASAPVEASTQSSTVWLVPLGMLGAMGTVGVILLGKRTKERGGVRTPMR